MIGHVEQDGFPVLYRYVDELVADAPAPRGLVWPPTTVPLVDTDPGYYCLELPSGRIIDWDPQTTSEWQDAAS